MNRVCWVHHMVRSDINCATAWRMHLIWHELYDQCIWSNIKCMWWMHLMSHELYDQMKWIWRMQLMQSQLCRTPPHLGAWVYLSESIRPFLLRGNICCAMHHDEYLSGWNILGPNKLWRIILMPPKLWCGRQFVKSVRGWIASPWLWPDTHLT